MKKESLINEIKEVFLKTTKDLSWLKKGQTVLVKPAVNSSYPHPSTTHPAAVEAICTLLKEKGARAIVGDQSGHEWVLISPKGRVRGSTIGCMKESGIYHAARKTGAEVVGFEDHGWDNYFLFRDKKAEHWPNGFWVTNFIKEADHIVSLPRLSTHCLTGVTLGLKNNVGWLRNDSRIEMHLTGPIKYFFTIKSGQGMEIKPNNKRDIFAMTSEISLAIKEKLRAVLYVAEEMQTTFGPDAYFKAGPITLQKSYRYKIEKPMVICGEDIVSSEIEALHQLQEGIKNTPKISKIFNLYPHILRNSKKAYPIMKGLMMKEPIKAEEMPHIKRAVEIGLGKKGKVYKNY